MAVSRAACWRPPLGPPRYWLLVRAQMIGGRWPKAVRWATVRVKFRGSEGRGLKSQRRQGKLYSTKSPANIVPMELTAYKKVQSSQSRKSLLSQRQKYDNICVILLSHLFTYLCMYVGTLLDSNNSI